VRFDFQVEFFVPLSKARSRSTNFSPNGRKRARRAGRRRRGGRGGGEGGREGDEKKSLLLDRWSAVASENMPEGLKVKPTILQFVLSRP